MTAQISRLGLAALALCTPTLLSAQSDPDRAQLVQSAFLEAKAAVPAIPIDRLTCADGQRAIALGDDTSLSFPCELQELVEDGSDAAMLVTLILTEPVSSRRAFETEDPAIARVAAAGTAVVGAVLDSGSDRAVVERARDSSGIASPGLAAYAPADSRAFRTEAARLKREEERALLSERTDEIARERAREASEQETARKAEYASVTNFLELANRQGFCPADGRAFLKRATEYATSPLQEDRIYGLWADDKRHVLDPYLNDLSRCR